MELSTLNEVRLIELLQETNNLDEINTFMYNYLNKIENFVKLMRKVSKEREALKRFQGSTFDTISGRKFIEDREHYP